MTFRVNGRDIFCKGANWVPADALPSRWTRERYDALLSAARWANMNCLRVWGGGRYEAEDFYDLCDEKGILVWQDFMFACALYPSSPSFLDEVEAEVSHQVMRLASHPCVALWCGSNENLGALGWYPESKANPMRYIVDYDRLTEGTIGRIARKLDPGRPWWPTSPCGGPSDYSDNWHGDGRGDMHFWSVWHEGKSFSEYLTVKPRFCSEFGFQSFPNPATVASFAPEGERNVASPAMEHHQRHGNGNAIIVETMSRYFRLPTGAMETLYLSQVQQAMAIRTAVDWWRGLRPRCMGTLYWQLNDVWPVSSWSSLDYDGSMKLLHYEARRFFDPFRVSIAGPAPGDGGLVRALAVNDGTDAVAGLALLRIRRLDGKIIAEYRAEALIEGESAAELLSLDTASLPCPREEAFLEAVFEPTAPTPASYARSEAAFLTEPKRCSLVDPGIESELAEADGGIRLAISASRPAFFVAPWLDPSGAARGSFEDAAFHLMPGEERSLRFVPYGGAAMPGLDELRQALRILHLRMSYE
jgi:beta-mannosidase